MSRPSVLFDLETAGLSDVDRYVPPPDPPKMPSNYTKEDTIRKWQEELPAKVAAMRADSLAKAALDPHVSRIVVLGYAFGGTGNAPMVTVCHTEQDEQAALWGLWSLYSEHQRPKLVGWWVKFDIRTALIRSRYLGVPTPAIDLHPYNSADYLDLMELFDVGALARGAEHVMSLSQDAVYNRLGGPELNDPITGAEVPACVSRGDYASVEAHNRADLQRLRHIATWLGVIQPIPQAVTA